MGEFDNEFSCSGETNNFDINESIPDRTLDATSEVSGTCEKTETAHTNEISYTQCNEGETEFVDKEVNSSQEIAEKAHVETKQSMINENGKYMSDQQIEMLKSNETTEKINVMHCEEYLDEFPDVDVNVLGHCDSEGNIYMKDISPEIVEHVSTHETMHLCSNRENYIDDEGNKIIVSGIRESVFDESGKVSDINRAANEGFTEMYTLRELHNREEVSSAYAINSYSESRMWSERIEKLVGTEKTAAAYFGGEREVFQDEFNRLNNDDAQAWENYSKDIDILEYSNNSIEIENAKWRLVSQYSVMVSNRYGVKGE